MISDRGPLKLLADLGACEGCRKAKAKCDRGIPRCSRCIKYGIDTCIKRCRKTSIVVNASDSMALPSSCYLLPIAPAGGQLSHHIQHQQQLQQQHQQQQQQQQQFGLEPKGQQMDPRRFAEEYIVSFLKHAQKFRQQGGCSGGSKQRLAHTLKRWTDLMTTYEKDFSLGALSAIQAIMGVMPEPVVGKAAAAGEKEDGNGTICSKTSCHATSLTDGGLEEKRSTDTDLVAADDGNALSPGSSGSSTSPSSSSLLSPKSQKGPFVICSGICGRRDVPKELFALDDGLSALAIVVTAGPTNIMGLHLNPAFEKMLANSDEMLETMTKYQCLPEYAVARFVIDEDMSDFSDAVFSASFLCETPTITSTIVKVRDRNNKKRLCLVRARFIVRSEISSGYLAVSFTPLPASSHLTPVLPSFIVSSKLQDAQGIPFAALQSGPGLMPSSSGSSIAPESCYGLPFHFPPPPTSYLKSSSHLQQSSSSSSSGAIPSRDQQVPVPQTSAVLAAAALRSSEPPPSCYGLTPYHPHHQQQHHHHHQFPHDAGAALSPLLLPSKTETSGIPPMDVTSFHATQQGPQPYDQQFHNEKQQQEKTLSATSSSSSVTNNTRQGLLQLLNPSQPLSSYDFLDKFEDPFAANSRQRRQQEEEAAAAAAAKQQKEEQGKGMASMMMSSPAFSSTSSKGRNSKQKQKAETSIHHPSAVLIGGGEEGSKRSAKSSGRRKKAGSPSLSPSSSSSSMNASGSQSSSKSGRRRQRRSAAKTDVQEREGMDPASPAQQHQQQYYRYHQQQQQPYPQQYQQQLQQRVGVMTSRPEQEQHYLPSQPAPPSASQAAPTVEELGSAVDWLPASFPWQPEGGEEGLGHHTYNHPKDDWQVEGYDDDDILQMFLQEGNNDLASGEGAGNYNDSAPAGEGRK